MTAQELRIGNLVYLDDTIITITLKDLIAISQSEDWAKLYQPIPLTEDILFEHKWLQVKSKHSTFQAIQIGINHNILILDYKDHLSCVVSRIKYLHQLQNFYFALNGEELPVNL
jgi:hypothetical protein